VRDSPVENRLKHLGLVILAVLVVLTSRLWYLQIMRGDVYEALSVGNRVRVIPGPRTQGEDTRPERRSPCDQQDGVLGVHRASGRAGYGGDNRTSCADPRHVAGEHQGEAGRPQATL